MDCQREWLYDVVWYSVYEEDDRLRRVELVLESEWATRRGAIKEDFEKLLVARCPWKVMVFAKSRETEFEYLREGIQRFERQDSTETYVLAGFDEVSWSFQYG